MKKIIILGGKGTAVNVAEAIYDASERYNMPIKFIGFAFDDESFGTEINGFPILGKTKEIYAKYKSNSDVMFIFQMTNLLKMEERLQLINSYNIPLDRWYTFVHPSSFVAKSVKIGVGTVVMPNCAIHPNTQIGDFNTICANTTIGHDTITKTQVFCATQCCIGSYVTINENVWIGQNVIIKGECKINKNNLIGIGTKVIKDINATNKIFINNKNNELTILKNI